MSRALSARQSRMLSASAGASPFEPAAPRPAPNLPPECGTGGRPQRIVEEKFEAFRVRSDGALQPSCAGDSFDECRDLCAAGTPHKSQFIVRRTNLLSGAVTLHVFQVRQGKRRYVIRDHVPQWVRDEYAEEISVVRVVEPQYPDETAQRVGWPFGAERPVGNSGAVR